MVAGLSESGGIPTGYDTRRSMAFIIATSCACWVAGSVVPLGSVAE